MCREGGGCKSPCGVLNVVYILVYKISVTDPWNVSIVYME